MSSLYHPVRINLPPVGRRWDESHGTVDVFFRKDRLFGRPHTSGGDMCTRLERECLVHTNGFVPHFTERSGEQGLLSVLFPSPSLTLSLPQKGAIVRTWLFGLEYLFTTPRILVESPVLIDSFKLNRRVKYYLF